MKSFKRLMTEERVCADNTVAKGNDHGPQAIEVCEQHWEANGVQRSGVSKGGGSAKQEQDGHILITIIVQPKRSDCGVYLR